MRSPVARALTRRLIEKWERCQLKITRQYNTPFKNHHNDNQDRTFELATTKRRSQQIKEVILAAQCKLVAVEWTLQNVLRGTQFDSKTRTSNETTYAGVLQTKNTHMEYKINVTVIFLLGWCVFVVSTVESERRWWTPGCFVLSNGVRKQWLSILCVSFWIY